MVVLTFSADATEDAFALFHFTHVNPFKKKHDRGNVYKNESLFYWHLTEIVTVSYH